MKSLFWIGMFFCAPGLAFSGVYHFYRSFDSDTPTLCQDFEIVITGSDFSFRSSAKSLKKNLLRAARWRPVVEGTGSAEPRVWEDVVMGPSELRMEVIERSGFTPPFGEFQTDWNFTLRPHSAALWEVEIRKSEAVRPAVALTHLRAACLYRKNQL